MNVASWLQTREPPRMPSLRQTMSTKGVPSQHHDVMEAASCGTPEGAWSSAKVGCDVIRIANSGDGYGRVDDRVELAHPHRRDHYGAECLAQTVFENSGNTTHNH